MASIMFRPHPNRCVAKKNKNKKHGPAWPILLPNSEPTNSGCHGYRSPGETRAELEGLGRAICAFFNPKIQKQQESYWKI